MRLLALLGMIGWGSSVAWSGPADPFGPQAAMPQWVVGLFESCTEKRQPAACAQGLERIIGEGLLWGDSGANYRKGVEAWGKVPLRVVVTEDRKREGGFSLVIKDGKPVAPELRLSLSYSLPEILITLNHELVHYANSRRLIEKAASPGRTALMAPRSCVSDYQLEVLGDESRALRSEIAFWLAAPDWFRKLFDGVRFDSKLTRRKRTTYPEHYALLADLERRDPAFGAKLYVEAGEYPRCALARVGAVARPSARTCVGCVSDDARARSELARLGGMLPRELLAAVRKQGVCVKILDSGRPNPGQFFYWASAEPVSGKLEEATQLKNLMGKTFCKDERPVSKGCVTIVLASDAPRSTLLHEWLHVRQLQGDPSWCSTSQALWTRKPTPEETVLLRDKEWDVHRVLWQEREKLGFGVEDMITVAAETLEEAQARKSFDPEAERFVLAEKLSERLAELARQYSGRLRPK